jgi:type IV pilus assembly protein PilN
MAHINLLPWREQALRTEKKEFFTQLTVVAVIAVVLVIGAMLFFQAKIDGQETKNQYLRNEIQILDIKIAEIKLLNVKKKALQQRISVIEQLQRSRNVGTQVLDEMARVIPNGIYLTHLNKQGNSILLTGKSESNNHLANMIREVDISNLFADATPESITTDEKATKLLSDFKMRLRIQGLVNDLDAAVDKAFKRGK